MVTKAFGPGAFAVTKLPQTCATAAINSMAHVRTNCRQQHPFLKQGQYSFWRQLEGGPVGVVVLHSPSWFLVQPH